MLRFPPSLLDDVKAMLEQLQTAAELSAASDGAVANNRAMATERAGREGCRTFHQFRYDTTGFARQATAPVVRLSGDSASWEGWSRVSAAR